MIGFAFAVFPPLGIILWYLLEKGRGLSLKIRIKWSWHVNVKLMENGCLEAA